MVTGAFVYFMANKYNTTLYVGVTNDLLRRVAEHKTHINKGFTDKYNCEKLVYFEDLVTIEYAIESSADKCVINFSPSNNAIPIL